MATSADYAPFEYIDTEGTGDFTGIDIELPKQLRKNWDINLKFKIWILVV